MSVPYKGWPRKEYTMLGNIGLPEIAILATVLLVLFGSKQLPRVARSVGESGKDLKHATQEFKETVTNS